MVLMVDTTTKHIGKVIASVPGKIAGISGCSLWRLSGERR